MKSVLFHVRIETASDPIYRVDLSEDALLIGFLGPLKLGGGLRLSDSRLIDTDTSGIRILRTAVAFDDAVYNSQSLHGRAHIGDRGSQFEVLTGLAHDATAEMLTRIKLALEKVDRGERAMERNQRAVFLVHGRDSASATHIRTLLRSMGLQIIEWEQAVSMTGSPTPYIGEVIERGLSAAGATLVLLTPDDQVILRPDLLGPDDNEMESTSQLQARPNVYYEAGLADGMDRKRVLIVEIGRVKQFSDAAGRHVVRYNGSASARNSIAQRLQSCGAEASTSGSDWLQIPYTDATVA